MNVRFNDLWTPETLAAELRGRLEAVGAKFTLALEPCNAIAFLANPDALTELVAKTIEKKTGQHPKLSTSGGTSDARFIQTYCPVLEFGLIGATAHMVDERIAVADLAGLTEIYAAFLEAYFGKDCALGRTKVFHVKHFCPIEAENLTNPHTSASWIEVGLRGKTVILAIGRQRSPPARAAAGPRLQASRLQVLEALRVIATAVLVPTQAAIGVDFPVGLVLIVTGVEGRLVWLLADMRR